MIPTNWMTRLIALATLFAVGHHIDHIIRGNHVGWPLIPQGTAFTVSLGFYPIIAAGYLFYKRGAIGAAFWSILAAVGLGFVGLTHLGPFALEPPGDIVGAYSSRLAGMIAFVWLLGFLAVLLITTLYAGRLWRSSSGSAPVRR